MFARPTSARPTSARSTSVTGKSAAWRAGSASTAVLLTLTAMSGSASARKVSCSEAAAKVTAQGYKVLQTTCGGKTHTFSTLEGEAVLVKVNAQTGKLRAIYGGD